MQSAIDVKESLPQPSPGYDRLYPKENAEEGMSTDAVKKLETLYSALGEPVLSDLPLFAYQISQGMVCATKLSYMQLKCMINVLVHLMPHSSGIPLLPGYPPP